MNSIVSRAAIAIALMSSASVNAQVSEPSASEAENDLAANYERTIVVTAQRREQSLQDVPIAISAFGAETLQDTGVTSLDLLGRLTPGLTVAGGRGGSSIFLRGVGARTTDPGDTASVAVYVDGVYMPSPLAGLFSYPDVERIEVLKGPQGTLFGQSATGGLLHIITRKPSFTPEGEVRVSYGNFDTVAGRGYISSGLTDTIAASISLNGNYQGDGFGRNLTTGNDVFRRREWSTRGKILWEPTPDTEVVLTGFYGKDRTDYGTTTPPPGSPVAPGFVGPDNPYDTFANTQEFPTIKSYGGSLRIVHDFGGVTLTSTTGYGNLTRESVLDQEQSPVPFVDAYVFESSKNWQQEFLLTGSTGRLDWAAGIIHFEDVSGVDPVTIVPPPLQGTGRRVQRSNSQTLNSTAVFGQITYAIIDPLRVTLGFRNTWDSRRLRFLDQVVAANSFDPRVSPVQAVLATVREDDGSSPTSQASWSEPTYRIGLDYDFSEGLLLYASFSTGYKTGTFSALNIGPVGQPPSVVEPETLDAFEAGFKWDSSDGLLRVNASAFHYDFKNIQLLRPFVGGAEPFNAASTRIRGIDFDATVFASSALTMTLSAAYLDPRYTSFPDGRRAVPNPDFGLPGPNGATPFNVIIDDLAGERPSDAPTFTASFSADFRQPVSFGPFDEFQANFLYNYNDGFLLTEGTDFFQESYHLINLRVGLGSQKGWEINAFMNNITDQAVIRAATRSAFGDAAFYAPPRTYGLELGFRW